MSRSSGSISSTLNSVSWASASGRPKQLLGLLVATLRRADGRERSGRGDDRHSYRWPSVRTGLYREPLRLVELADVRKGGRELGLGSGGDRGLRRP